MKINASFRKYTLNFKFDAGTSRGVLKTKDTYLIKIHNINHPEQFGLGECGPLKGLSIDDRPDFEFQLSNVCQMVGGTVLPQNNSSLGEIISAIPSNLPSIRFGIETALLDLIHGGKRLIVKNDFYNGLKAIPVNGLIWMGDMDFMQAQIKDKITEGYTCIKIKIGALDFEKELALLHTIRKRYSPGEIIIRVDANGAFQPDEALKKLNSLSRFQIHSIEQPIQAGLKLMADLCKTTPIGIALDEELIGIVEKEEKLDLLNEINPQFIILKPTLVGGLSAAAEWIALAESMGIGWWITSALESNIGLNAISQFTAGYHPEVHQGLGTGKLYTNNAPSPLETEKGYIRYNKVKSWDFNLFNI